MRTTQFVGLTKDAKEFLKGADDISSPNNFTTGMFDEKIQLGNWIKDGVFYSEVVQSEIWSSGPVILTHLAITYPNVEPKGTISGYAFSWVLNPKLKDTGIEIDFERGQYYI